MPYVSGLKTLACLAALFFAATAWSKPLRYPDIHDNHVVFVYTGDLYIANTDSGETRRLTSHEGQELFPKFSPDGKHVAFSGEYNGTRQVFVIGVDGGTPQQLTFYNDVGPMPPRGGFDYQVLDWTPDGEHVLFRGNRLPWGPRMGKYYTVPAKGGLEQALAIPEGGTGSFSPDGKKMVYTPIAREFRTWKRYRGGRAQDVWVYDLEKNTSEALTTHQMTDALPVWIDAGIFFISDRDGTLNLFKVDPASKQVSQVTQHKDFDVWWPSAGSGKVVYEHGGGLRVFNPADNSDTALDIKLSGDRKQLMPRWVEASEFIDSFAISPNAKRAVFAGRGDVFTVPVENGTTRNHSHTPSAREKDVSWSPDGQWIAFQSDAPGDYEIFVQPAQGGEARQLTKDSNTWMFAPQWSPDSKKLIVADLQLRLMLVDVATGKVTQVDQGKYRRLTQYSMSPDGNWLVYTKNHDNGFGVLWAYDVANDKKHQLTDEHLSNYEPAFSPDGKYLYFVSDRDMNLGFSSYEFTYLYRNSARVYAATTSSSVANPFALTHDEEEVPKAEPEADADKDKKDKKGKKDKADAAKEDAGTKFEVEGFEDRVFVLDVPDGGYAALNAVEAGPIFAHISDQGPPTLKFFDMKSKKLETLKAPIQGYSVAAKSGHVLTQSGPAFELFKVAPGAKPQKLDLSNMDLKLDPRTEWQQIYNDAARMMGYWFYDEDMHGYDWDALVAKYQPLVEQIASRADLDYILGELGGELNAGHYYVNRGDEPGPSRNQGGLLGAEIATTDTGYYQITEILPGENWHDNFRNPLREVGVDVNEGDYIISIDGVPATTEQNFYAYLEGKGNRDVVLKVNNTPKPEGAREVTVKTTTSETGMRYLKWVRERQAMVDKLSGGRVGYIHLPNTAFEGNRELFRHFYAQAHKDALILDDRYNGGGFIPFNMIELLERPVLSYWSQRYRQPFRTPQYAHMGPKACLINGYSSSGGDAFPHYFRQRGMGKLFGTRTWGGLIGLQGNPGFVDGGSLSIPVFRVYDSEGNWLIENEGVSPDVEVLDRPELIAKGEDPTLKAAVEHLLEELKTKAYQPPAVPDPPNEAQNP